MTKAKIIETIKEMRDRKQALSDTFFKQYQQNGHPESYHDIFIDYAKEAEVLNDLLVAIGENQ